MGGRCPLTFVPSGSTWTSCSPRRPSCTSAPSLWIDTLVYETRSTTAASTPTPRPASRSWQCGRFQWVRTHTHTHTHTHKQTQTNTHTNKHRQTPAVYMPKRKTLVCGNRVHDLFCLCPCCSSLVLVSLRIDFKVLLLVFKSLSGQTPASVWDLLTPDEPDRCWSSSGRAPLMVPKSGLVNKWGHGLCRRIPQLWNSVSSFHF